ncbi:MBL fold metallo-hydrolase [Chitinophaga solisilvae]|uniref:MBL fold metallo-hydrolase n=1 Tax=Chitinophaga solisilvae TaxID=1233460 RepID=UPI0013683B67|nr:MBL fold metallo-hydrolase [Chitinophaga solisilvae]
MIIHSAEAQQASFFTYHGGARKILVVNDGEVPYDNACFAPGVARSALSNIRNTTEHFRLPHNILVLRSGDRTVLMDAGNGHNSGGLLTANLQTAGIQPQEVTDIVLTHAHPDHICGLVQADRQLVFPAATIHLSCEEYTFWQSAVPDFSRSKEATTVLSAMQQEIRTILTATESRLQLFSGSTPLFDFLKPVAAAGHTPGHYMFEIQSEDKSFMHMGDICHDDQVLFRHPDWGTVFDIDFMQAAQVRVAVLRQMALSGQLVFGYHLPWPGFGRVVADGEAFRWVPEINC